MDIWFIKTQDWTQIRATSVHGILWLQTHFENNEWEAIASDTVKITNQDANLLAKDAQLAGLILNSVPALVNL